MTVVALNKGIQNLVRHASTVIFPSMVLYVTIAKSQGHANLGEICQVIDQKIGGLQRAEKLIPVTGAGLPGSRVFSITIRPPPSPVQQRLVNNEKVCVAELTDCPQVGSFCKVDTITIVSELAFKTQNETVFRAAKKDEVFPNRPAYKATSLFACTKVTSPLFGHSANGDRKHVPKTSSGDEVTRLHFEEINDDLTAYSDKVSTKENRSVDGWKVIPSTTNTVRGAKRISESSEDTIVTKRVGHQLTTAESDSVGGVKWRGILIEDPPRVKKPSHSFALLKVDGDSDDDNEPSSCMEMDGYSNTDESNVMAVNEEEVETFSLQTTANHEVS